MSNLNKLLKFRKDRDFEKFHTPERLSMAIQIEAGELAKLFQWGASPDLERVSEEIADIAIYLEYLAHDSGLDIQGCIEKKIIKNEQKYPVDIDHIKERGWTV